MAINLTFIVLYLALSLLIGMWAMRSVTMDRESFYMANRQLDKVHLFMAGFATMQSTFAMTGLAGMAYKTGFAAIGFMVTVCFFALPVGYYLIGYRSWLVGKRYGYATLPQVFAARYASKGVLLILLVFLIYYSLPFLITTVIGSTLVLQGAFPGLPYWLGALIIVIIVSLYTIMSGMLGTSWTDVFQGFVFLIIAIVVFIAIATSVNVGDITAKIINSRPDLLTRGRPPFIPKLWLDNSLIMILAPLAFPQIFVRIMAARSARDIRYTGIVYAIPTLILWGIPTILGTWGAVLIPGLTGNQPENIVPMLMIKYLSPVLGGLGFVMLMALANSTMDSVLLTMAHLVEGDVVGLFKKSPQQQAIAVGRVFMVLLAVLAFIGALIRPSSIVNIGLYSFAGFSLLLPTMILGLHWRRANHWGAIAGMVVSEGLYHLWYFKLIPLVAGIPAFTASLLVGVILLVGLSYLTKASTAEVKATGRFFTTFDLAMGDHNQPITPGPDQAVRV